MRYAPTKRERKRRIEIFIFILVLAVSLLIFAPHPKTHLDRVKAEGVLKVATRFGPTTFYEGPEGPTGFEFDLSKAFADSLGVELDIVVPERFPDIFSLITRGEVDLAAAGLTVTEARKQRVRFGPKYQDITQQVVYRARKGKHRPRSIEELIGTDIEVVAGSSHVERLQALQREHPGLSWVEHRDLESEELLNFVWEGLTEYTIADSNEVLLNQRFYPDINVAFDISDKQALAWAFDKSEDKTLFTAAQAFFAKIKREGTLEQLIERHYGHTQRLDYAGTRVFMRAVAKRLPRYRDLFEEAGREFDMDWRLLAAIGYQESYWNPKAVSPTGVRGIMMLTQRTARQLGISNRSEPRQSIMGGARYLAYVKQRIPERIPEPDRTWLALAAYNVGFGHLEDARKLTQALDGDPDKWIDVMEHLPLLSRRKWYSNTRYGYARGREPVQYVQNIRSYYDILIWATEHRQNPMRGVPDALLESAPNAL